MQCQPIILDLGENVRGHNLPLHELIRRLLNSSSLCEQLTYLSSCKKAIPLLQSERGLQTLRHAFYVLLSILLEPKTDFLHRVLNSVLKGFCICFEEHGESLSQDFDYVLFRILESQRQQENPLEISCQFQYVDPIIRDSVTSLTTWNKFSVLQALYHTDALQQWCAKDSFLLAFCSICASILQREAHLLEDSSEAGHEIETRESFSPLSSLGCEQCNIILGELSIILSNKPFADIATIELYFDCGMSKLDRITDPFALSVSLHEAKSMHSWSPYQHACLIISHICVMFLETNNLGKDVYTKSAVVLCNLLYCWYGFESIQLEPGDHNCDLQICMKTVCGIFPLPLVLVLLVLLQFKNWCFPPFFSLLKCIFSL